MLRQRELGRLMYGWLYKLLKLRVIRMLTSEIVLDSTEVRFQFSFVKGRQHLQNVKELYVNSFTYVKFYGIL